MNISRHGLFGRSSLRLLKVARAALRPRRHARLAAAMRRAQRDGVYLYRNSSFWKYLDIYLVRGISTTARARIIERHYRFLDAHLASGAARSSWNDGAIFWSDRGASEHSYKMTGGQAVRAPCEGEGEFALLMDDGLLETLTFAIAPGELFGLADHNILVVGGLQGIHGRRSDIRAAAKDHGEIAPTAMLLLAAKAFAEVFGIDHIVGVSNRAHVEQGRAGKTLKANYDRQWNEAGAIMLPTGLFVMDATERNERSLTHLSSAHRARARRKAARKAALQATMRAQLRELFVDTSTPSIPAAATHGTHVLIGATSAVGSKPRRTRQRLDQSLVR